MHKVGVNFIKEYLKDGYAILDVGCGTGNLLLKLKELKKNFLLFGIDESGTMIRRAKRKIPDASFFVSSAESLPFENNRFDFITTIDSFYYFKNKEKVISECYRTLKVGGYFFIFTMCIDNFWGKISVLTSKILPTEKYSKHLKYIEIKNIMQKNGFTEIKKSIKNCPFFFLVPNWLLIYKK